MRTNYDTSKYRNYDQTRMNSDGWEFVLFRPHPRQAKAHVLAYLRHQHRLWIESILRPNALGV